MSNAAWSTNLTANAVDLTRSDGRILMRIVRGLNDVASVRGVDTVIPSATGRVPRNRVADVLKIEAQGFIFGAGATEALQRADFRTLVDSIRTLMNPTQAPYTITAILESGATRTISARPINVIWGDDSIPTWMELSCEWESVSPTWT